MTLSQSSNVGYLCQGVFMFGETVVIQGRHYQIYARRYDLTTRQTIKVDSYHSWTRDLATIIRVGSEILLNNSGTRPEETLFDFIPGKTEKEDQGYIVNTQNQSRLNAETIQLSPDDKKRFGDRLQNGLDVLREMDGAISRKNTVVAGTAQRYMFRYQNFDLPQAFLPKPSAPTAVEQAIELLSSPSLPLATFNSATTSSSASTSLPADLSVPSSSSPAHLSVVADTASASGSPVAALHPPPIGSATTSSSATLLAPQAVSSVSISASPVLSDSDSASESGSPVARHQASVPPSSFSAAPVGSGIDSASGRASPVAANFKPSPVTHAPKAAASEDVDDSNSYDWLVEDLNLIPLQFDGKKVHYKNVAEDNRAVQAFNNLLETPEHQGSDETVFRNWLFDLVRISYEFHQKLNLDKAYSTGGEKWGWSKEQYLRWLSVRIVLWKAKLFGDSDNLVNRILKV